MSVQDLAPSSLKKFREEREEQYLKQHILKETGKILLKSHKGEEVLDLALMQSEHTQSQSKAQDEYLDGTKPMDIENAEG